ncbi:MAG: periplasmic heavy metal sensor [Candidatus Omnitrophota bacterium]|nr:MAG: periplasmic heavy metal sensor [Candidatus Omnitrophota bacterium]
MKVLNALKIVAVVLVVAGFVLVPVAYIVKKEGLAKGRSPSREGLRERYMHHMGREHHFIEKLGLNEEQQEKLLEQRRQQHAEGKELAEQLKAQRKLLREEFDKLVPDPKALKKISAEIKKVEGQMLDLRINGILATKEILTPQQYQQMKELREEYRQKPKGFIEKIRDWWRKRLR